MLASKSGQARSISAVCRPWALAFGETIFALPLATPLGLCTVPFATPLSFFALPLGVALGVPFSRSFPFREGVVVADDVADFRGDAVGRLGELAAELLACGGVEGGTNLGTMRRGADDVDVGRATTAVGAGGEGLRPVMTTVFAPCPSERFRA